MLCLAPLFVLVLATYGTCVETNLASMQWNGKNIQYFNTPTALFEQSSDCLPGFFKGRWQNESCYMFVITAMPRTDANTFCTESALGNGLVAIETELHHAHIVGQIAMHPELRGASPTSLHLYWTSGENVSDGVWTWRTTLRPFTYTKFWSGESPGTGYLALYEYRSLNPSPYYDWRSIPTNSAYRSICQHFIVS